MEFNDQLELWTALQEGCKNVKKSRSILGISSHEKHLCFVTEAWWRINKRYKGKLCNFDLERGKRELAQQEKRKESEEREVKRRKQDAEDRSIATIREVLEACIAAETQRASEEAPVRFVIPATQATSAPSMQARPVQLGAGFQWLNPATQAPSTQTTQVPDSFNFLCYCATDMTSVRRNPRASPALK
eukprot:2834824-Rhodomonas_salina.2